MVCLTVPFGLILTSWPDRGGCAEVPAGGQQRGFLHVLLHLAVVSTYYGTLMVLYTALGCPPSSSGYFALLYCSHLSSILVYTLRNKEVQQPLWMLLYVKQAANQLEGGWW